MKKVRLLQLAVYIVFAALFLQDAAGDFYKGFNEGYNSFNVKERAPEAGTTLIPGVQLDGRLVNGYKNGVLKLNDNYTLENAGVIADLRVKDSVVDAPLWISFLDVVMVFFILVVLVRIAYTINKIIVIVYEGDIFERSPIKMIRQTGILLIIYSVADYVFQLESFYKDKALINSPVVMLNTSSFNFEALMCGLLVLIVAEAFKQGALLKEEQELTI